MIVNCKIASVSSPSSRPDPSPRTAASGSTPESATAEATCGLRCLCGSLLARYVPGGVELKCRRCKRTIVVQPEGQPVETTG